MNRLTYWYACLLDVVSVRRLTSAFVGLRASFGLKLHYDWQGGRIYVQLESTWTGGTLGLCGTLNGNLRDDFLYVLLFSALHFMITFEVVVCVCTFYK